MTDDDSAAQHQDMLEKEERLREHLVEMHYLLTFLYGQFAEWNNKPLWKKIWYMIIFRKSKLLINIKPEDVDFVAAALGLSNYRN